jgi:peptide/nickel transport system permease protein
LAAVESRSAQLRAFVRIIAREFAGLVLVLLITSFIIFASLYLGHGSPTDILFRNHVVPHAERLAIEKEFHLNDPFFQRYWLWLTSALHGNFGESVVFRVPVSQQLDPALVTSGLLILYAGLIVVVLGVGIGIVSALRRGVVDQILMFGTSIGVAIPTFVAAIIMISIFAVDLGWFPVYGDGSGFVGRVQHLTLPAFGLALWAIALVARVTRSSMREEMHNEHVQTAEARGLKQGRIVRRHVFRNAMIPISTVAGMQVAGLVAGTVVVEQIFGLDGIGQLLENAVNESDFATVQAATLVMVTAFVVMNRIVDVIYVLLDPRLRIAKESGGN